MRLSALAAALLFGVGFVSAAQAQTAPAVVQTWLDQVTGPAGNDPTGNGNPTTMQCISGFATYGGKNPIGTGHAVWGQFHTFDYSDSVYMQPSRIYDDAIPSNTYNISTQVHWVPWPEAVTTYWATNIQGNPTTINGDFSAYAGQGLTPVCDVQFTEFSGVANIVTPQENYSILNTNPSISVTSTVANSLIVGFGNIGWGGTTNNTYPQVIPSGTSALGDATDAWSWDNMLQVTEGAQTAGAHTMTWNAPLSTQNPCDSTSNDGCSSVIGIAAIEPPAAPPVATARLTTSYPHAPVTATTTLATSYPSIPVTATTTLGTTYPTQGSTVSTTLSTSYPSIGSSTSGDNAIINPNNPTSQLSLTDPSSNVWAFHAGDGAQDNFYSGASAGDWPLYVNGGASLGNFFSVEQKNGHIYAYNNANNEWYVATGTSLSLYGSAPNSAPPVEASQITADYTTIPDLKGLSWYLDLGGRGPDVTGAWAGDGPQAYFSPCSSGDVGIGTNTDCLAADLSWNVDFETSGAACGPSPAGTCTDWAGWNAGIYDQSAINQINAELVPMEYALTEIRVDHEWGGSWYLWDSSWTDPQTWVNGQAHAIYLLKQNLTNKYTNVKIELDVPITPDQIAMFGMKCTLSASMCDTTDTLAQQVDILGGDDYTGYCTGCYSGGTDELSAWQNDIPYHAVWATYAESQNKPMSSPEYCDETDGSEGGTVTGAGLQEFLNWHASVQGPGNTGFVDEVYWLESGTPGDCGIGTPSQGGAAQAATAKATVMGQAYPNGINKTIYNGTFWWPGEPAGTFPYDFQSGAFGYGDTSTWPPAPGGTATIPAPPGPGQPQ